MPVERGLPPSTLRVDVGRLFPLTPILSDTAPAVESDARYFGGGDLCGRTEFERAVAEMPRLVAPAEPQTGARQRVIEPGERREDSARRQTLEERLAFPEPVQRLARLAELRPEKFRS